MKFIMISFLLCFGNAVFAAMTPLETHAFSANYFDQFLFQPTGNCKDLSSVWFLSTASWTDAALGKDANGRELRAWYELQILSDGTYWARYQENAIIKDRSNGVEFETVFQKDLTGSWQQAGAQITFQGLGVGTAAKVGAAASSDGFKFHLTAPLHDPRAVTSTAEVGRVATSTGPYGQSINEYCGNK